MTPRASVVIPTRGGRARLPRLLGALAAQSEPSWEAVVVVDGDVDGTADLLRSYGHLPVRPVVFPENQGRAQALNAGFAAALGDVLIRCDDDLDPAPDYVQHHLDHHAGAPVGVIGLYRNVYPDTPYARVYGRPADVAFRRQAYGVPAQGRWRYWAGNCSVTRETYERIGAYDSRFRAYGWEDGDWGYRLANAGIPIELAPDLETDHLVPATTTQNKAVRAYLSGAARVTFERKHGTGLVPMLSPTGVWNRLVDATSKTLSRRRAETLGAMVDVAVRLVPAPAARKFVALTVEASAHAGYRHPDDTTTEV